MTILWAEMVFWTKAASGKSAKDSERRDAAMTKIDAIKILTTIEALRKLKYMSVSPVAEP
ncbi:hypothetical protein COLO4_32175 [Corchorus olitorius]|uniref:Uncharacterized protein n=1 Tax=Corchorus olitorius TaxID=93759 RepID=A0A1R3H0M4_9ROSI|nr:hypothetical protein COLO4_32175 [Corchorus olitorius]